MNRETRWLLLSAVIATAVACSSTPQTDENGTVTLIQASTQVPEDQLVDVVVKVFDAGLPPQGQEIPPGVFPDVRRAEARYIAVQLADTLQGTGHWGAVRVAPAAPIFGDLTVTGTIIDSTGKRLVVSVLAADSTGRVWLDRKYKEDADTSSYAEHPVTHSDPFQNLYNRVSNDLTRALMDRTRSEISRIRSVTELEYAADLLPSVYSEYLGADRKGRTEVERLPAENDPMMERIAKIREREAMFIDVLNQHYVEFHQQMQQPYDDWRTFAYQEETALDEMRRKARTQKILGALAVLGAILVEPSSGAEAAVRDVAVLGGMAAINAGFATSKEAKIHIAALEELGASFEAEVEPLVIEVEGHTLRLTGSVEEQYETWRRLLHDIYATETGFPIDPNTTGGTSPAVERRGS